MVWVIRTKVRTENGLGVHLDGQCRIGVLVQLLSVDVAMYGTTRRVGVLDIAVGAVSLLSWPFGRRSDAMCHGCSRRLSVVESSSRSIGVEIQLSVCSSVVRQNMLSTPSLLQEPGPTPVIELGGFQLLRTIQSRSTMTGRDTP